MALAGIGDPTAAASTDAGGGFAPTQLNASDRLHVRKGRSE